MSSVAPFSDKPCYGVNGRHVQELLSSDEVSNLFNIRIFRDVLETSQLKLWLVSPSSIFILIPVTRLELACLESPSVVLISPKAKSARCSTSEAPTSLLALAIFLSLLAATFFIICTSLYMVFSNLIGLIKRLERRLHISRYVFDKLIRLVT